MMRARLQGHVGGRAASRVPGRFERDDFGVGLAGQRVPALAPTTEPSRTITQPTIGFG